MLAYYINTPLIKWGQLILIMSIFASCTPTENKRDQVLVKTLQEDNQFLEEKIRYKLNYTLSKITDRGHKPEEEEIGQSARKVAHIHHKLIDISLDTPLDTSHFLMLTDSLNIHSRFIHKAFGGRPSDMFLSKLSNEKEEYRAIFNQQDSISSHLLINRVSIKVYTLMDRITSLVGGGCNWNFCPDVLQNVRIDSISPNRFKYPVIVTPKERLLSSGSIFYNDFEVDIPISNLTSRSINNACIVEFENQTGAACRLSCDLDYKISDLPDAQKYFNTHCDLNISISRKNTY